MSQPKSDDRKKQTATLTLPDGKMVELPVYTPSDGPPCIDVRTLQSYGYYTYDPGFTSTASCSSVLSYIDGPKGLLLHRGYRIEDLAANCSYLEVAYLLLNGNLPTRKHLEEFTSSVLAMMMLHMKLRSFFQGFKDNAHPMAIMVGVVGSLSAFYDNDDRATTALRVIAKLPTIAAMAYKHSIGQPYIYPRADLSYAENFLHMMFATPFEEYQAPDAFVKALDLILLLHADHEQNASTTTVRIAGSSDANPLACVAAGIASLWGPMHGGANEATIKMLREIGTVEAVPEFLERVKTKECKLMGFGHRVYKNVDPRAKQMKVLCDQVINALGENCDPTLHNLLQVALTLEKAALADEYFTQRKLFPNVDFYSGLTLTAMGIPTSMFTVLFAIGRSVGWIAQWKESVEETGRRISRPRQMYIGETERPFIKIDDRIANDDGFIDTAVKRQRSLGNDHGVVHTVGQKGMIRTTSFKS
uniref:Citrate synthase n=1 Tax=Eutreptiella gymnastica TaxID=73025 RepID=A0A7S1N118_9EUGL|mmetsp:Transcript_101037/g.174554  ORF Transcript_101037/g.174554 Transcript_101037/m.174554 type:complete len:474 (+) Transcript_101037:43-1464(+)